MKKLTIKIPQDRERLYTVIRYPAGEIQVRLTSKGLEACQPAEGYEIICNPIPDFIELAQLVNALGGVHFHYWYERKLFLPYMPYARADRRFVKGDCDGLGTWARLINALDFTAVWTFDVHSKRSSELVDNLANMLPTDGPVDQIAPIIKKLGRKGLVLISPDEGASKRYDLKKYKLPLVQCRKKRDASTGQLSGFEIWWEDRDKVDVAQKALIIDDICDGGGTFIGLADELQEANPMLDLYLYVSHGIFSKGQTELRKHFEDIFTSKYSFDSEEHNRESIVLD